MLESLDRVPLRMAGRKKEEMFEIWRAYCAAAAAG